MGLGSRLAHSINKLTRTGWGRRIKFNHHFGLKILPGEEAFRGGKINRKETTLNEVSSSRTIVEEQRPWSVPYKLGRSGIITVVRILTPRNECLPETGGKVSNSIISRRSSTLKTTLEV